MMKKLVATLSLALVLSACSTQSQEPEPTTDPVAIGTVEAPSVEPTPSDEPTEETSVPSEEPIEVTPEPIEIDSHNQGTGTSGFAQAPEGLTSQEWEAEYKDALSIAYAYWRVRNGTNALFDPTWAERAAPFATEQQQKADHEEANDPYLEVEAAEMEDIGGVCTGHAWPEQGVATDLVEPKADDFVLAFPARQECYWGDPNSEENYFRKLDYQRSPGLGGLDVEMISFRMQKIDGQWYVAGYDYMDVPQWRD